MSAADTENEDPVPPRRFPWRRIVLIGLVSLGLLAASGGLYMLKKNVNAAAEGLDEGEEATAYAKPLDAKSAPIFLPLDNMVVNLADAGGNRFIQVGLTLQLEDNKTADAVRAFMPSIRSRVLLLISQRTADDMLSMDGKKKLANDIMVAIAEIMGYLTPRTAGDTGSKAVMPKPADLPVQAVHFSSLIVQ